MQKINYIHGIDPKDLRTMPMTCKHGTPLAHNGLNVCALCHNKQTIFTMPDTFGKTELCNSDNDLHLFDHSEYGEPGPGTAAHIATMSNLQRMIAEECVNSTDRINRINLSGIEDRRPHYDRLDSLAYSLGMVDDTKHIDPLAGVILDAFRALGLDETARKRLTLEIRKDHTKAQLVIDAAREMSEEIIPPIPLWICNEDGSEIMPETEELKPTDQADSYATPLGDYSELMPVDYIGNRSRSASFRTMKDRIAIAVQNDDGKALAQVGKDLYALAIDSQEKSVLFHLHSIAKNKVEYHLEHRFAAMLRRIAEAPHPEKLGKKLFDLSKHTGEPMHRTGKEGRPKFTSAQWAQIWAAYRVRVPKAAPTEQIPLFEPPAF